MNKVNYVEWVDSRFWFGWQDPDELSEEPITIKSIGFLVKEDDNTVILTNSLSDASMNVGNPVLIPKCSIIRREPLTNALKGALLPIAED